jgi:hypothetical protein
MQPVPERRMARFYLVGHAVRSWPPREEGPPGYGTTPSLRHAIIRNPK